MGLLPGEEIDLASLTPPTKRGAEDDRINERYAEGDIRIVTEQARYPLNTIVGMVDGDKYELNPEFQRRHRWDAVKRSRLIESFIMNVPIPPVFLYEVDFSEYEVMDGLQRLSAIADFYKDRYALTGLEEWKELNGRTYSQLPDQVRRGIDRRYLSSIILLRETAKSREEAERLKQLVFERINSGGVQLKPQETRNALYNGKLNQLCIRLARNKYLCRTWGIPEPTPEEEAALRKVGKYTASQKLLDNKTYRTMDDVELVLRFFAFRQIERLKQGSLEHFLDVFLQAGNLFPDRLLEDYARLFTETIRFAYRLLGVDAFKPLRRGGKELFHRPVKMNYDALMSVLSEHLEHQTLLIKKKNDIGKGLRTLYKEHAEAFAGRKVNMTDIRRRHALVTGFITSLCNPT